MSITTLRRTPLQQQALDVMTSEPVAFGAVLERLDLSAENGLALALGLVLRGDLAFTVTARGARPDTVIHADRDHSENRHG